VDKQGKVIKAFKGGRSAMQNFIDAVIDNKIAPIRAVESAHYSSALAHLGTISLAIHDPVQRESVNSHPALADAYQRLETHLAANQVDLKKTPLTFGSKLQFDPQTERFTGPLADKANPLLTETYRQGFALP
jgi:hypothetical protein